MTDKLPKVVKKRQKRKGRGYGSGKGGHTAGRGAKGQKARSKVGLLFEGIKTKKSFIKRLPLKRGKGKFKKTKKPLILKLSHLDLLPAGSKVNVELLVKHGIVRKKDAEDYGIKILGDKGVKNSYTVEVPVSNSAAKLIEKAGGKVVKLPVSTHSSKKTKVNKK